VRPFLVSLLFLASACAHSGAEPDASQLARSLDALRAQVSAQGQQLETLQGRLDVMAAASNAMVHGTPRNMRDLEVVKLEPTRAAVAPEPEEEPVMLEITGEGDRLQVVKMPPAPRARAAARAAASPPNAAPTAKADPLDGPFADALDAYRNGRTEEAFERFANLMKKTPKAEKASAALYWMGESRFDDQRYEEAIIQYKKLVDTYASSSKAPEAMLKMAISFEKLHDSTRAKECFQRLVDEHPDSAVAELARARPGIRGGRSK
jgi:tol-pal system protein YbgF